MAEFRVIAGDFGQDVKGDVRIGKMWRESAQGFSMPMLGHAFRTEHIGTGEIATLEIATEENLKKMRGAIGWGFLGGLALGPIGALAGVLAGGRKLELTFLCQFKDGRRFLGQCDPKTYVSIQAAAFVAPRKGKKGLPPGAALGIFIIFGVFGMVAWVASGTAPSPTASPIKTLDQPALKLVAYLLTQDMKGMLIRDQSSAVWPDVENLLGWLGLGWRLPATNYEADYDNNEIHADNEFKGQKLLVSGTVVSISKDFADEGYVVLHGSGLMGVRAQLSRTGAQSAASFRKGQSVNLVCTGGGQVITIATLESCEGLGDYLEGLSPSLQDRAAEFLGGGKPLGKAAPLPIVSMYVTGLHLPHNSPCLNGERDSCKSEIKSLLADRTRSQAIHAEAITMLASLKKQ